MADEPDRKKGKDRLSGEDKRLWARVMENVRPLPGKSIDDDAVVNAVHPVQAKPPEEKSSFLDRLMEPIRAGAGSVQPGSMATDMDRRTADKLKRGKMPIEGVLDLHGLRQHEAQARLTRMILDAYRSGRRCILVITGKGSRSAGDEPGVLRRMLPLWLEADGLKSIVLAVEQARPKDGGGGAFYVYLRRQR